MRAGGLPLLAAAGAAVAAAAGGAGEWVAPPGLPPGHNGGVRERLVAPAAGRKPHILSVLWDDYGWAEAGWHRNYTIGGVHMPATREVQTPVLDSLVREGIELDRGYVYKCCSPTRSAVQSGRHPYHVNALNSAMEIYNAADPVGGMAGIPRNMTGVATKLAAAGYKTHMFGKWDAGMATPDHTPTGRGYQSGLWYYHHDNDYWSMLRVEGCDKAKVTDLWLGRPGGGGPALGYNNTCVGHSPAAGPTGGARPAGCAPGPKGDHWYGGYEDALFEQQVLATIDAHDPADPLFIFWAPHLVHGPLQVPQQLSDPFAYIAETDNDIHSRQRYHSMVKFGDEAMGNVTAALRAKGMWGDLLITFMADNGGWVSKSGKLGGNNYPLKGGKYNNWEGGIRSNSFVSGGFLPAERRGVKFGGLVTAWDWYATFCGLAGVDATDHRAALAGLPPIDSYDLSPVLTGASLASPRREMAIGAEPRASDLSGAPPCASLGTAVLYDAEWSGVDLRPTGNCSSVVGLMVDDGAGGLWKLITGDEKQYVPGGGPQFPNDTTGAFDSQDPAYTRHCGRGCLFNVAADPLEENDLAAAMPGKVAHMRARIEGDYLPTAYNPRRGSPDPAACAAATGQYGGFWGPFVE